MDDRVAFDVYVEITDPSWDIEHEARYGAVSVVFGEPGESPPSSLLRLCFKDLDTIVALGQELTNVGKKLAAQLRALPDSADSDQVSGSEEYPVPERKPSGVESGEDR